MYPYEREAQMRVDIQKGRPFSPDKIDKEATKEAEVLRKMRTFRSAFNPTSRGSKFAV